METTRAAFTSQPTRLSGRWLTLARVGWCVLAIYPMVLFGLGIAPALNALRVPCDPSACIPYHWGVLSPEQAQTLETSGLSLEAYALAFTGLEVFQAVVFAGCGWLIFLRRSNEAIALIASLAVVSLGVYLIPNTPGSAFVAFPALWPLQSLTFIWGNWLFPALLYLLPDGRFVPRWGRWFFILWGGLTTYGVLTTSPTLSLLMAPSNVWQASPCC
ncbi:MAG: hypothetical protein ACT4QE_14945 [Anaerolineales bacterium]